MNDKLLREQRENMKTILRVEIEGDYLVIEREGITKRIAAGALSPQLVPQIVIAHIDEDGAALVEKFLKAGISFVGLTVSEKENMHALPEA